MTTALPNYLPTPDDLDAEEAALAAADAAATRTVPTPSPRDLRTHAARILSAEGIPGDLAGPPRTAVSPRALAPSLLGWAAGDPVGTLPPLRLQDGIDPGDLTRSGSFALAALGRALAPDLAERGWRISAGSLSRDGRRQSDDDLVEAAAGLVREAVALIDGLEAITAPAPSGVFLPRGARRYVPSARYAGHLTRVAAYGKRACDDADRLGTPEAQSRALAALYQGQDARALLRRQAHDENPARFAVRLRLTLGDLATPRARRAFAAAIRSGLPPAEPATVEGLAAAREWLGTFSGVVARSALFPAYVAAGAAGDLDKPALLALAVDVFGPARRRAQGYVHVIPEERP